jgi:uncharacterized protein (DUF1697 family)
MNARMPELRRCFAEAGFGNVATVLASGNVVFDSRRKSDAALARQAEAAMAASLDPGFPVLVRPVAHLQALLDADPFARFRLPAGAKKVVTLLREPVPAPPSLPLEKNGARLLAIEGLEAFSAYVPTPGAPAFMALLEKAFGKAITTRTWDTVRKCAAA